MPPLLSFAFVGAGAKHRGSAFHGATIGYTPSPSKLPWDLGGGERDLVLGTEHALL